MVIQYRVLVGLGGALCAKKSELNKLAELLCGTFFLFGRSKRIN